MNKEKKLKWVITLARVGNLIRTAEDPSPEQGHHGRRKEGDRRADGQARAIQPVRPQLLHGRRCKVSTPWIEVEKAAKSLQDSITFLLNHDGTVTDEEDYRLKCTEGTVDGFLEWIKDHKR